MEYSGIMEKTALALKEIDWEAEIKKTRAILRAFGEKHQLWKHKYRPLTKKDKDEMAKQYQKMYAESGKE